ncbi:hypothetical protein LXA43DRAFT_1097884 [Ganoderma leucocontextum]|nr:hypothetical protein LXA43DRAFT_1097884 [Ganoderma leucocontextum]
MSLCILFTISSAYNLVLSCLTQLELVNTARICHHAQAAVEGYQRAAFDINRYLSYYFDALPFRNLQARTGTLLAGSVASCFLERSPLRPRRVELLVYPQHTLEIAQWLLDAGYSFVPWPGSEAESCLHTAIARLLTGDVENPCIKFEKSAEDRPEPIGAVIFVAPRSPIEFLLTERATILLNLIAWEKAYCLFPRAFLHERRILLLHDEDGNSGISQREVASLADSYVVTEFLNEDEYRDMYGRPNSTFPLGWRWVNDSSSLSIHLNVAEINLPLRSQVTEPSATTAHHSVDSFGFRLCYSSSRLAHIKFDILHSHSAHDNYTVCDSELSSQLERALGAKGLGCPDDWRLDHGRFLKTRDDVLRGLVDRDRIAMECLE